MGAATSFDATTDDGEYQFAIASSGNTLTMAIDHWKPGVPTTDAPSDSSSERLTNVTALGNAIRADGPTFGLWFAKITPHVEFVLSEADQAPSVRVVVTGAPGHNSDKTYPVSAEARADLGTFVTEAAFPAA